MMLPSRVLLTCARCTAASTSSLSSLALSSSSPSSSSSGAPVAGAAAVVSPPSFVAGSWNSYSSGGAAVVARACVARSYSVSARHPPRLYTKLQPSSQLQSAPSAMTAVTRRSIFIQVEGTPNPDSMKFIPEGQTVLPEEFGSGKHYSSIKEAKGSKLVFNLLQLPGVTEVFLGRDFVSINKEEQVEWMELKPLVFGVMMDAYSRGEPIVDFVEEKESEITEDDDEVVSLIKYLMEEQIRPSVQADGGDVFFDSFVDGVVKVRLAGSCVGCPSSSVTLKQGVEQMLRYYIPEVESVEEVVDEELESVNKDEFESLEQRLAAAGVPGS